jgi:hypothetical protein
MDDEPLKGRKVAQRFRHLCSKTEGPNGSCGAEPAPDHRALCRSFGGTASSNFELDRLIKNFGDAIFECRDRVGAASSL